MPERQDIQERDAPPGSSIRPLAAATGEKPARASLLSRLFRPAARPAAAPEGMRIYAVGDIHGRADLLDDLTAMILTDSHGAPENRVIVYLGDYIDRGTDSRGVIERLLAPPGGFQAYCLRGNHDQILLDFLEAPAVFRNWRDYGARETLMSYGVIPPRFDDDAAFADAARELRTKLPKHHQRFLESLPYFVRLGDYHFVHAGVRPGTALDAQDPEDMLWIRDDFLYSSADFGAIVVHGHTPEQRPVCKPNRIGLDTGAWTSGRLTAAVFEGTSCRFLHT